jgi:hypothetical protein
MSPRIPDTHAEAWALLPWLANGRIAGEEREWVEAHVHTCAECRAELAAQRMISSGMRDDAVPTPTAASDEQRSFDKLWARIEASESATLPATGTGGGGGFRASRTVRWLAAAVIVQAVGLGVLGFSSLSGGAGTRDDYINVTREDPPHGSARAGADRAPRLRAAGVDRNHQHAARAPGSRDRRGSRNAGQLHCRPVGRCSSLWRFGGIGCGRDVQGSECQLCGTHCSLSSRDRRRAR